MTQQPQFNPGRVAGNTVVVLVVVFGVLCGLPILACAFLTIVGGLSGKG
ncbi:MAG TPA: hypothetical protein VF163_01915 [Micromonosporaceae bacterium]